MLDRSQYYTETYIVRDGRMRSPVSRPNHVVQWAHLVVRDQFGKIKKVNRQLGQMKRSKTNTGWHCECDMTGRSIGEVIEFGSKRYKTKEFPKEIVYAVILELDSERCKLGISTVADIAFADSDTLINDDGLNGAETVSEEAEAFMRSFISAINSLDGAETREALLRYFVLGCRLYIREAHSVGRNACYSAMKGTGLDVTDLEAFNFILKSLDNWAKYFLRIAKSNLDKDNGRPKNISNDEDGHPTPSA